MKLLGLVVPIVLGITLFVAIQNGLIQVDSYLEYFSIKKPSPYTEWKFSTQEIPTFEVTSIEDFSNHIAFASQPGKFIGTQGSEWPAISKWQDKEYLKSHIKQFTSVGRSRLKSSSPHTFLYFHNRPLANVSGIKTFKKDSPKQLNYTTEDYLDILFQNSSKRFYYYAQPIETDFDEQLLEDIQPHNQLLVKETWNENKFTAKKINVWMGVANATTHLHYDWSHNFHVQVKGSKHFLLFPPSEWRNLYLFPYLHPFGTKSQVSVGNPNLEDFPNLASVHGYEVILNPGETLYIPPLWFHQVKSLTAGISVSIWSHHLETLAMDRALSLGLPISKNLTKEEKIFLGIVYTRHLVFKIFEQQYFGDGESEELVRQTAFGFLAEVLKNRYKNVVRDTTDYQKERLDIKTKFYEKSWKLCPVKDEFEELDLSVFEMSFESVTKEILLLFSRITDWSRKEIWLGDYIELIGSTSVDPEEFGSYTACLRRLAKDWIGNKGGEE